MGRLWRVEEGGQVLAEYAYDANGNRSSVAYANGATASYVYDMLNRLDALTNAEIGGDDFTYDYTLSPSGARIGVSEPVDGSVAGGTHAIHYDYDALGRLTAAAASDRTVTYEYDAVGNRTLMRVVDDTGVSQVTRTVRYEYDAHDRLLAEHQASGIALGAAGWKRYAGRVPIERPGAALAGVAGMMAAMFALPLLMLHGLLGGLKRRERRRQVMRLAVLAYIAPLFAFGPETIHGWFADFSVRRAYAGCAGPSECSIYYRYDHNGNLVAKWLDADGPSGGAAAVLDTRYVWDAAGRLIVVDPTPGGASLGSITYYRYDHEGIRVGRSSGGVDVRFVVDKQQPYAQVIEERRVNADRSTTLLVRYTHGDDLISQQRHDTGGAPARYYYHYDGQMSARHLTDESGAPVNRHRYDAFGQDIDGRSDAPVTNDYRYTGEQYDGAAGMYYLRARYYAPGQGRFVSRDPFEGYTQDPMSLHKYLYAHGGPIDRIDPTGMFGTLLDVTITTAIVGMLSGVLVGAVTAAIGDSDISGIIYYALLGAFVGGIAGAIVGGVLFAFGWAGIVRAIPGVARLRPMVASALELYRTKALSSVFPGHTFHSVTPRAFLHGLIFGFLIGLAGTMLKARMPDTVHLIDLLVTPAGYSAVTHAIFARQKAYFRFLDRLPRWLGNVGKWTARPGAAATIGATAGYSIGRFIGDVLLDN